jgi:hypothetical protein
MLAPNLSPGPLRSIPADRKLFVDREFEADICRRVLQNGGNVLVSGPRGVGKTSFVRFVAASFDDTQADVSVVDGRAATSAGELLSLVRDALAAWTTVRVGAAASLIAGAVSSFAADPRVSTRPPRSEVQLLIDELHDMRQALDQRRRGESIVFLDEVPSPEVGRVVFGRLRDELWELPITWCVAVDDATRAALIEPPADAFWSRTITLETFDRAATAELLKRRLGDFPLAAETLGVLVEQSGGNPRHLLNLANAVVVERRSLGDVLAEQADRAQRLAPLSEPSRRLLAELEGGGPASPSDGRLQRALGLSRGRIAQLLQELESAHLVRASAAAKGTGRPRKIYEAI